MDIKEFKDSITNRTGLAKTNPTGFDSFEIKKINSSEEARIFGIKIVSRNLDIFKTYMLVILLGILVCSGIFVYLVYKGDLKSSVLQNTFCSNVTCSTVTCPTPAAFPAIPSCPACPSLSCPSVNCGNMSCPAFNINLTSPTINLNCSN